MHTFRRTVFFLIFFTYITARSVTAQVFQDYRVDYQKIPVYAKTVQFFIEDNSNSSNVFLRQNMGYSEEPTAIVIPFENEIKSVNVIAEKDDPWNNLITSYNLSLTFAQKYVDYKTPPAVFTKGNKMQFYDELIKQDLDITDTHRNQIEDWFSNNYSLLLLVVNPVKESRITWSMPIMLETTTFKQVPVGWLRPEYAKLTSSKGKIIYAQDFEAGEGGWLDEYQGLQANSLVTRDNNDPYEGLYALKITNKPGSINAISTQTIGGLTPNEHYTFSAYIKNAVGESGSANLRVIGDGLIALSDDFHLYNPQSHSWQRIALSFQARSSFQTFSLMAGSQNMGDYVLWDNIQIEKGTQASAFNKESIGKQLDNISTEALSTSISNIEVAAFSDDTRSIDNIQSNTQCFNRPSIMPKILTTQSKYLCLTMQSINPNDVPQFQTLSINRNNIKISDLSTRANSNEEEAIPGVNIYLFYAILLITQVVPLIISLIKVPKKDSQSQSIFSLVIYIASSILFVATSLLVIQIVKSPVSGYQFLPWTVFNFVFYFCISIVYIFSLFHIMKMRSVLMYRVIQGLLSLITIVFVVEFSLWFSNMLLHGYINYLFDIVILIPICSTHLVLLKKFTPNKV